MALIPDIGQQVGWPRLIRTVDRVWRSIPARERPYTVIFTASYGEAAALDLLGRYPLCSADASSPTIERFTT